MSWRGRTLEPEPDLDLDLGGFRVDGLRVGVTGARKAAQLAAALERRGAVPVVGPLVTTDLPVPDAEIVADTDRIIAAAPAWVAASTGVGMRLWADVAARHGRGERLREVLAAARRVARGAKAVGGMAVFDLRPEHVTDAETDRAVADWLLGRAEPGEAVAVQLHGGDVSAHHVLREAGLELSTVRPYVAGRPAEDEARARDLVRRTVDGELDVLTFTSPGAARNLFTLAGQMGDDVAAALDRVIGDGVAVAAVGPVTAQTFVERGIPVAVQPERHRQGELVRAIERWADAGSNRTALRDRPAQG